MSEKIIGGWEISQDGPLLKYVGKYSQSFINLNRVEDFESSKSYDKTWTTITFNVIKKDGTPAEVTISVRSEFENEIMDDAEERLQKLGFETISERKNNVETMAKSTS